MSTHSEDGREIVARGRIRVDARRALAKLREHLLVDLHLYAVEIARAASASGATFLEVDYDADDVVLTFDGKLVLPDELPRLLDHVLSEGGTRALRGLALGVNAALGLGPAFVDIHTRAMGQARAHRVRFVPSILAGEDADLPEVSLVAPPKGMPEGSTRVHLRRRMGLDVLKRAASREQLREIGFLMDALHEAPLQLRRHGMALPLSPRSPALLRASFSEREVKRGVCEILLVPAPAPVVEYLELGVLLLRRPLNVEPLLPSAPHAQVELPLRVVVDAEELPTNASRSALREDSLLLKRSHELTLRAAGDLVRTLVALVTGKGKPLPGVEVLDSDPLRLEDALGAIVVLVAGAAARGAALSDEARALLDLPLLSNAVGGKVSAASVIARGKRSAIFVYDGKEPQPKELAPWLDDVIWLRGRAMERMLSEFATSHAQARLEAARVGAERRKRLHSRPSSEPSVPYASDQLVRETFHVKEGPFQGLRGQLALGAEGLGTGQKPSSVRIYVEGRHIDTLTIDRDKLPLVMDAAIAWDGHLLPKYSYEGVSDTDSLRLALFQLTRLAMLALGSHIERVIEQRKQKEREQLAPMAVAAVGAYVMAAEALAVTEVPEEPPLSAYTSLWTRGFWPSADPDRLRISLAELKTYVDRTQCICCVAPGVEGVAPDGRPVVAATDLELAWLRRVFPGAQLIPYGRGLRPPRAVVSPKVGLFEELGRARRSDSLLSEVLPSMPFEARESRGIIAPGVKDEILWLHSGVLLATAASGKLIEPATIVVEHDAIVPNAAWDAMAWVRDPGFLVPVRNELLRRIVAALEGDAEARSSLRDFPSETPGPVLRSFLIEAVPRHRGNPLAARIEALPLVNILDEDGRPRLVSLAEIEQMHKAPAQIPCLFALVDFPTLQWHPVYLPTEREKQAFFRAASGRAKEAQQDLEERRKGARMERERRAFRERKALDPMMPGDLADPQGLASLYYDEQETPESMMVAAALPKHGLDLPFAEIEVLLDRRLLCSRQLRNLQIPVVARVSLASETFVIPFSDLTAVGISTAEARVFSAACSLAAGLIKRAETEGSQLVFGDIRVLRLIHALYAQKIADSVAADILQVDFALRAILFRWPTVQDDFRAYTELVPGGKKLFFGRARYEDYRMAARGGSELDGPIVYLPETPEGEVCGKILALMGHELVDVTDAIAALQRKRGGTASSAITLPGSPPHPLLRASLASLKAELDGELEITEGPSAEVHVENLRGEVITLQVEGPFPFRARARVDDVEVDANDKKDIAVRLAKAAKAHLESLADRLDELPPFVRASLRRVVVMHSRKDKNLAKRRLAMRVFPDILGKYHSLADIGESGDTAYPYITFAPPHPTSPRPRPPLALTMEEFAAIQSRVRLEDVSSALQREVIAEQKRNAPPLEKIALDAQQRAKCLDVVPYRGEDGEGEVGILAPEHAEARGIWVHKTRRPLCRLPDGQGWPLLAVINDDSIAENRAFDGIRGQGGRDAIRARVNKPAEELLSSWFQAPSGMLASKRVHLEIPDTPLFVTGALWLPPSFAHAGRVEVRDSSSKTPSPRRFAKSVKHFDGTLPICGRLLVAIVGPKAPSLETAQGKLVDWLLEEAASLLLGLEDALAESKEVLAYRWLLALLGHSDETTLEALAGDGRRISAAMLMEELGKSGTLWYSRNEGSTEGQFPGALPPFVLVDDGGALFWVLRERAGAALREVGGIAAPRKNVEVVVDDIPITAKPLRDFFPKPEEPESSLVFVAPEIPEAKPSALEDDDEPASSFFRGLVQRVVELFDKPEPPDPATRALAPTLLAAIDKLGLAPTSVVKAVRYSRSGRPIVFDEARGALILNRAHPAVRALVQKAPTDERARVALIAASVREINRVLEVVTDATEQRVLFGLLRGDPI